MCRERWGAVHERERWVCVCACVRAQACALACILRGKSWPQGKMLVAVKKQPRRASKTARGETYWRFKTEEKNRGGERHCRKCYHISSPPLTFTVWHLMPKNIWRRQRKLLPFLLPFHPLVPQRASQAPHKLNITPLLTIHSVKSLSSCLIPSLLFISFCFMKSTLFVFAAC